MNRDLKYWQKLSARRVSRRRALAAGGATAMVLGLGVACGDDDDDDATGTPASGDTQTNGGSTASPSASEQPSQQVGGTLTMGGRTESIWSGAPYQLASTYLELFNTVNDTLFRYTSGSLDFEPRLANGYEFNGDESEIRVELKPDITFHDGKPIDAQAALDSFNSLNAEGTPTSQVKGVAAAYIDSAEAVDSQNLLFKLKRPGRLVFDVFHYWAIVDAATVQNAANGQPWNGSGPFKLTNVRPQQGATFVRHDGHFEPALLDSIEYRVFADAAALAVAIDAGEIDLTKDVSADDFERFKASDDFEVHIDEGLQAQYCIGMNTKGEITGDPRIRQALYHALDRQRIAEDVFLGVSQPFNSLWPPTSAAYESRYDEDPFDLQKAREFVTAAGYDGETPAIPMMCASTNFEGQRIFEIFQADAKEAGLNLELELTDAAAFSEQFQGASYPGMYTVTFGFNGLNPDTLPVMNFQVRLPNSTGFTSPDYEALLADMAAAQTDEERKELYMRFNEIWDEQRWVMLVVDRRVQWATGKNVGSFELSDWSIPLLNKATRA